MKRYAVVINDCAAPQVPGILAVRSADTAYGQRNFSLNFEDLAHGLPALLTERQLDFLEILGHLFAIDVACEREGGDVDWNRSIQAWLPVRDPDYWAAHQATLEGIFSDLTDDDLQLRFALANDPAEPPRMGRTPFTEHAGVALLSGGQDSFAGALGLLDNGLRPLCISHTASGATNSAQGVVEAALKIRDPGLQRLRLTARKAQNRPFPGAESSQRSRTLLFVGAASVVAAVGGSNQVWLNENGIMALHLPLTAARVGSLSTHTASPPIVARMQQLASEVLETQVMVSNELVGLTKPEVVARAVALGGSDEMRHTVSCWQIGRSRSHCGWCAPCLLRRISCETHSVPDVAYDVDVFDDAAALDDPRARDNLAHLLSLLQELDELDDVELEYEYPELLNGRPVLTLADAIAMHRRWAQQGLAVLLAHPVPQGLAG
jgi:7-cyano-7-deazaguanine synthase in queuosine biosynthesis